MKSQMRGTTTDQSKPIMAKGSMRDVKSGIIEIIVPSRGFGFIRDNETNDKIFFHASGVISPQFGELKEGHKVEYLIRDADRGKQAIAVNVLD